MAIYITVCMLMVIMLPIIYYCSLSLDLLWGDFIIKTSQLLMVNGYETFRIENNNKKVEVTNINYPL